MKTARLYTILDKENLLVNDSNEILKINIEEIVDEMGYFKKHILKSSYNNKICYEFKFNEYGNSRPKKLSIKYYTNNDNIVEVVNEIMNEKSIVAFIYYIVNAKIDKLNVTISEDNGVIIKTNEITLHAPHIKALCNTNHSILSFALPSTFIANTHICSLCMNTNFSKAYNKSDKITRKITDKINSLNIHKLTFTISFDYIVFEDKIFFVLHDYIREIKNDADIQEIALLYIKKMLNLKITDEEYATLFKLLML